MKSKKSNIAITIVLLVVGLLAFVVVMPMGMPFISDYTANNGNDFENFLLWAIPIFLFFGMIWGIIRK